MTIRNSLRNGLLSLVLAGSLMLPGCEERKKEYSDVMHEDAVVSDVVYSPSMHGSGAGPTMNFNGDLGIAFTSVDIPEKYAVVFECKHGKFIIQGTNQEKKDLWSRMKRNMPVNVTYKEVYMNTYDDGKMIEHRLNDYWFIDAHPRRVGK